MISSFVLSVILLWKKIISFIDGKKVFFSHQKYLLMYALELSYEIIVTNVYIIDMSSIIFSMLNYSSKVIFFNIWETC